MEHNKQLTRLAQKLRKEMTKEENSFGINTYEPTLSNSGGRSPAGSTSWIFTAPGPGWRLNWTDPNIIFRRKYGRMKRGRSG